VAITVAGILPGSHQMGLNFFIPIDDAMRALALTEAAEPMRTAAPASRAAARRKR